MLAWREIDGGLSGGSHPGERVFPFCSTSPAPRLSPPRIPEAPGRSRSRWKTLQVPAEEPRCEIRA